MPDYIRTSAFFPIAWTQQLTPISAPRKRYTFSEWVFNFLAADLEAYEAEVLGAAEAHGGDLGLDEWNAGGGGGGNGLADEYYGDEWADIDDGIIEMMFIMSLAAVLALLVWYRNRRQMEERRAREERERGAAAAPGGVAAAVGGADAHAPGQQPDGGFFPQPGDPNFLNWAAGGIGH